MSASTPRASNRLVNRGMFIDGNIFHSFGLAGTRANLYLGGRGMQEMVIYVGLKYGVEKEDPGLCRVTGDGNGSSEIQEFEGPVELTAKNSNRAFRILPT
ncbi:hypothetical protein CEXT_467801 [Caerostris extrusa]|uniref:Uncharacterized protein n=1 Tax=Caerostris extrusa TaxID=172846 RepID=A0AAV4MPH6_CAEEX|nr:hypothetical protein CEXT_467801 [Caerostris extrusa]